MFASDFLHEIEVEDALHEINEILERKDINDKQKAMILGENAKDSTTSERDSPGRTEDSSGLIEGSVVRRSNNSCRKARPDNHLAGFSSRP